MANSFYNNSSAPVFRSFGASQTIRTEYASIAAGFDKLPILSALVANQVSVISSSGLAITSYSGFTCASDGQVAATSLAAVGGSFASNLTTGGAQILVNGNNGVIELTSANSTANNKRAYIIKGATELSFGFHDDAVTNKINAININGGQAAGIGNIDFAAPLNFANSLTKSHIKTDATSVLVNNGGSIDFPNFSGLILLCNTSVTGSVALYLVGGNSISFIGQSFSGFTSGQMTIAPVIGGYRWTNSGVAAQISNFSLLLRATG